jgi:hypothetical protein
MVGDGIAPGSTILCPHCQNQFVMTAAPLPAAPTPAPAQAPGAGSAPTGSLPGPTPLAPASGPGPGGFPSQPVIKAVWSDVGRRHSPLQATNIMLGAGLVFVLIGVVAVVFYYVLQARSNLPSVKSPREANSGVVDLDAKVTCSPTEISITNTDPFAWTDVKVGINTSGGRGGYWADVKREEERYTESGRRLTLPFKRFTDSAGNTLDSAGLSVSNVLIKAKTSAGQGQCMAKVK